MMLVFFQGLKSKMIQRSFDDYILDVFESASDSFFYPISTQRVAKAFVKALHNSGVQYVKISNEINEPDEKFSTWRKGLRCQGVGQRVIERINQPVRQILEVELMDGLDNYEAFFEVEPDFLIDQKSPIKKSSKLKKFLRSAKGNKDIKIGNESHSMTVQGFAKDCSSENISVDVNLKSRDYREVPFIDEDIDTSNLKTAPFNKGNKSSNENIVENSNNIEMIESSYFGDSLETSHLKESIEVPHVKDVIEQICTNSNLTEENVNKEQTIDDWIYEHVNSEENSESSRLRDENYKSTGTSDFSKSSPTKESSEILHENKFYARPDLANFIDDDFHVGSPSQSSLNEESFYDCESFKSCCSTYNQDACQQEQITKLHYKEASAFQKLSPSCTEKEFEFEISHEECYDSDLDEISYESIPSCLTEISNELKILRTNKSKYGFVYVFCEENHLSNMSRFRLGASRNPEKKFRQACCFNTNLFLAASFEVPDLQLGLKRAVESLDGWKLTGHPQWFEGNKTKFLEAFRNAMTTCA